MVMAAGTVLLASVAYLAYQKYSALMERLTSIEEKTGVTKESVDQSISKTMDDFMTRISAMLDSRDQMMFGELRKVAHLAQHRHAPRAASPPPPPPSSPNTSDDDDGGLIDGRWAIVQPDGWKMLPNGLWIAPETHKPLQRIDTSKESTEESKSTKEDEETPPKESTNENSDVPVHVVHVFDDGSDDGVSDGVSVDMSQLFRVLNTLPTKTEEDNDGDAHVKIVEVDEGTQT